MMDFVLKMMDCVLKMMQFVLQMMDFALKRGSDMDQSQVFSMGWDLIQVLLLTYVAFSVTLVIGFDFPERAMLNQVPMTTFHRLCQC